jgi:Na+/melibiose symporter-like transporter
MGSLKLGGLWKHPDFMRLWTGQTISVFGSMIGGTAMTFAAILVLKATPFQLGVLNAMQIAPALVMSLVAGAWVDRVRRRPLLIGADLLRALILATIPLAAFLGVLRIGQLFLVALAVSLLSLLFDVAYQSYLPALIGRKDLLEGNSRLSASSGVAEFGGFSLGGWLVQALTAPLAILVDAASFLVSALTLGLIRKRESALRRARHRNLRREVAEGLREVLRQPLLRASALVIAVQHLADGLYGALVVLYMSRSLGFNPGLLGMFWAVGGISSFLGALLAPRVSKRLGCGLAMALGLAMSGVSQLVILMAVGPTLISGLLLIGQQLGDGFQTMYEINQVSLRQGLVSHRVLGRVNATMHFLGLGASLAGALVGGWLGGVLGVRPVLLAGGLGTLLAALALVLSPLRGYKER